MPASAEGRHRAVAWGDSREKLPGAVRIPVDEVQPHLGELPPGALPVTYCT
jgi:hypothetical protein